MKKQIIFGSLFVLLTPFFAIAQKGPTANAKTPKGEKAAIKWGPEYKASRGSTIDRILGMDETGYYAEATEYHAMGYPDDFLEKYSPSLEQAATAEVNFKKDKVYKKREYEFVIFFGGNLYMFSSSNDKDTRMNNLYVQTVNKSTMELNNDVRKIAAMSYNHKGNDGTFGYSFSRDSTKLLLRYELERKKKENEEFGLQVYDTGMKKIWEKEVTLPYSEELFDIDTFKIDNKGNAYVLGRLFHDRLKESRHGKPNYDFILLAYRNNGADVKEQKINLPDKFITDMAFTISDNGSVVCSGLYSNQGTYSIRGCFFITFDDRTFEVKTSNSKDFGLDFITQYMSEKAEKKTTKKEEEGKEPELYQYKLDKIVLKEDGGAVLIGEKYYVYTVYSTYTTSTGVVEHQTTYYYHYMEIFVVSVAPDGTIQWAQKIPKVQVTIDDGGRASSYALAVTKDKLHFIFNDNQKNLNLKPGEYYKNPGLLKNTVVSHVTLDGDGHMTKETLFSVEQTEIVTFPKVCRQISENQMLIFGQLKKTHKFGVITFN